MKNLRLKYILLTSIIFIFCYKGAEFYARSLDFVPSFFMNWERKIPFIALFMLPYMTSAPYFMATFLINRDEESLKLNFKRANFMTITSALIFVLFPLKFYFIKPEIQNFILAYSFKILHLLDSNFNQCPSLHVSYSFLAALVYFKELESKFKYFLVAWGLLITISVLFVYQHHFIDFVGGFLMFAITCLIFREKK